jgi:hypothetical protein
VSCQLRVVSAPTYSRRAKELSERKTREQRAAADARCEDDQFSGDRLHKNS